MAAANRTRSYSVGVTPPVLPGGYWIVTLLTVRWWNNGGQEAELLSKQYVLEPDVREAIEDMVALVPGMPVQIPLPIM